MAGPGYGCFVPLIFRVNRGEGIGEAIMSCLQNRDNFPAHLREKTCLGVVMSATGNVLNPELELRESSIVDGVYELQDLKGIYEIPKDGDVRVSGGLRVMFSGPEERSFGGPVVGPLVAATPVQVVALIAGERETTYVSRISQKDNQTGNDDSPSSGNDDSLTSENDDSLTSGNHESPTSVIDDSLISGYDESSTSGNDESPTSGYDESPTSGNDESSTSGNDESPPS